MVSAKVQDSHHYHFENCKHQYTLIGTCTFRDDRHLVVKLESFKCRFCEHRWSLEKPIKLAK